MPEAGETSDEVSNAELAGAELTAYEKGRDIFDGGAGWRWVWTGARFELASAWSSPLCRGMPGGAALGTWVRRVLP